ncbi:hypothetical protein AS593_19495 [Caulobacter vibrioides]|nr:hypothetical protein AS593_19495 [Caulobacter vibrioides]
MRRLLVLVLMLAASPALARQAPRPEPTTRIVVYGPPPGVARCEGRNVGITTNAPFHPEAVTYHEGATSAATVAGVVFGIDAEGDPVDIKAMPGRVATTDLMAAFARWRFMAGPPARNCHVEVSRTVTPLAQATTASLLEIVAQRPREPLAEVRRAILARGDCGGASPPPAQISHPDLRGFEGRDFVGPWAGLLYDIDAEGVVRNVRVATQGGDPVLAEMGAAAVAQSRYYPGRPVAGCYGSFSAKPKPAKAPARTAPKPAARSEERSQPRQEARPEPPCRIDQAGLNLSFADIYPPALLREQVQGWARVRFDISSSGQVTSLEVLEAQPLEAFGQAARTMLARARPAAGLRGQNRCEMPVAFSLPGGANP